MGSPRTSAQVLLLSVLGVVCLLTLISAVPNTTLGPDSLSSENSKTNPSNGYHEPCQAVNLPDASHRIAAAVDTLAGELSCKRRENGSSTEDMSRELEQNLRQIVELTLKVFSELVN